MKMNERPSGGPDLKRESTPPPADPLEDVKEELAQATTLEGFCVVIAKHGNEEARGFAERIVSVIKKREESLAETDVTDPLDSITVDISKSTTLGDTFQRNYGRICRELKRAEKETAIAPQANSNRVFAETSAGRSKGSWEADAKRESAEDHRQEIEKAINLDALTDIFKSVPDNNSPPGDTLNYDSLYALNARLTYILNEHSPKFMPVVRRLSKPKRLPDDVASALRTRVYAITRNGELRAIAKEFVRDKLGKAHIAHDFLDQLHT